MNRITVNLSNERMELLEQLMKDDIVAEMSKSVYMGLLIANEVKRRREEEAEKKRRTVGRPRKADAEAEQDAGEAKDEPRNIPHPEQDMNAGVMLTQSEYDAYIAYRSGQVTYE